MTTDREEKSYFFLLVLACLYFAQGLPFGLLAKALPALAREAGLSRAYIGLLALPAAPWALKFLWAPFVDRMGAGAPWHRKRWIVSCQWLAILLLAFIASLDEARLLSDQWWLLLLMLTLLNTVCATQDIATDGLATRWLPLDWRGLGNSIQVTGYKVGLMLGGASFLMLVSSWGWRSTLLSAALLMAILLLPLLFWREPLEQSGVVPTQRAGWRWWWMTLLSLFKRPSMGLWLLVLMGYRTGEDFGAHMVKPWLVDSGWSLAAIGRLEAVAGMAGLVAAAGCGMALRYVRHQRVLLTCAVLQVLVLLSWSQLVRMEVAPVWIWMQAIFEQCVAGMAAVVLMTMMMARCRPGTEGADFTLQISVQLSVTGSFVLLSGVSADWLGYQGHFLLAAALAFLVILPILLVPDHFPDDHHER